jgi:hypothetical protein
LVMRTSAVVADAGVTAVLTGWQPAITRTTAADQIDLRITKPSSFSF